MVYAASSSTYGDSQTLPKTENVIGKPLSPYAVTKLVNEIYADVFSKVYGFHTIGLRYFNVLGPNQSPDNPYAAVIPQFIKAAVEGKSPIIFGDGETSRDFTFVENVIQANIKSLMIQDLSEPIVCNFAIGEQITLNNLWRLISNYLSIPNIQANYKPTRTGDIRQSLAYITSAKIKLGYLPNFNVKGGLDFLINKVIKIQS